MTERAKIEKDPVAELSCIARSKFHEGKLDEYERLSARAMEIVRTKDTGTLQYDTHLNEDRSECVIISRAGCDDEPSSTARLCSSRAYRLFDG